MMSGWYERLEAKGWFVSLFAIGAAISFAGWMWGEGHPASLFAAGYLLGRFLSLASAK